MGGVADAFADYDLTQPFGPVNLDFGPPPWTIPGTLYTSAGDLDITSVEFYVQTGPDSFQYLWQGQLTVTPEPSSWLLAGLGLLCLLGYGWRRWKRAATAAC
jgi:hypothetical protein